MHSDEHDNDGPGLTPLPVQGYQPQTQSKVDLVNRNKEAEERVLRLLDDLDLYSLEEVNRRWLSIGRTHLEQGFMAINRAIFQPLRVKLDEPSAERNFMWAMAKMADGYAVRRPFWQTIQDVRYLTGSGQYMRRSGEVVRMFDAEDILAEDWELGA